MIQFDSDLIQIRSIWIWFRFDLDSVRIWN